MAATCKLTVLALFVGSVVSCRSLPGPKEKEKEADPATPVGTTEPVTLPVGSVHLVDESARFVLIRSGRNLQLEPGTVLTLLGDSGEQVGQVEVSPARKGTFLTADIVSGSPKVGQRVTMQYQREPSSPGVVPAGDDPNAIQILE